MSINERQVALRKGGNYPNLDNFFDRRKVVPLPFDETAVVAAAGVNVKLLDNTMVVASAIALGVATVENGGLFATLLPGAVGTGSTNTESDNLGNILNMVQLRDATSHDPIVTSAGREVYGLIQAVSTASDGDAIGAPASENIQISFVYVSSAGVLTLTLVTATVEFQQNNVYTERNIPTIKMEGGNEADALAPSPVQVDQGEYLVTTAFVADEVITLSTGAGAASGVATKTGETIDLGASAAAFNGDNLTQVLLNGVQQIKGTEVVWDTSGTMHFANALDVDDYFEVQQLSN